MTPNKQVLSIWFKMLNLLRNEGPVQQIIVATRGYATRYSNYMVPSQDTLWRTGGMRVTDSEEKGVMTLEREWEQ